LPLSLSCMVEVMFPVTYKLFLAFGSALP
jgi:hypothetical protein